MKCRANFEIKDGLDQFEASSGVPIANVYTNEEVRELREIAKDLPYDFWVTLVGDTITEEALPTYESWLMDVEGVDQVEANGWSKWVRQWTGEENRHGDLLNKYLSFKERFLSVFFI